MDVVRNEREKQKICNGRQQRLLKCFRCKRGLRLRHDRGWHSESTIGGTGLSDERVDGLYR